MNHLDELLAIPDKQRRQVAMLKYAESLGIKQSGARNSKGEYQEERLAILIYDAQERRQRIHEINIRFVSMITMASVVLLVFFYLLPRWGMNFREEGDIVPTTAPDTVQAFDEKGKPLEENGKPVLFQKMHGEYQEYDDDGALQYEYFYDNGQLLWKREFNANGDLIEEKHFSKP